MEEDDDDDDGDDNICFLLSPICFEPLGFILRETAVYAVRYVVQMYSTCIDVESNTLS